MNKKNKWIFIILCLIVIIILSFLFYSMSKLNEVKSQNEAIVEQQIDVLKSIETELNQSTSPIFQSYGKIKQVEGLNRSLILSFDKSYSDYGNHLDRMLKALEDSFSTFTDHQFTKEADRQFLADQVSYVLKSANQNSLTLKIADSVYNDILNQTREYYETYSVE